MPRKQKEGRIEGKRIKEKLTVLCVTESNSESNWISLIQSCLLHENINTQSGFRNIIRLMNTFPLGRPSSLSAWKITFSVFPDAKVLVILGQKRKRNKVTINSVFSDAKIPLKLGMVG